MPFDPTNSRFASPLAGITQDRMMGMMNQPQTKVFSASPQDHGTNSTSQILPTQDQLNRTMGMAKGGQVNDELASVKDTIRAEFAARGLDFDRFVSNPAVMDEVGKAIQSQGKNGDTILAHINPEEAKILKERGGAGTINPATGLPQFAEDSSSSNQDPGYSSSWSGGSGSFSDFGSGLVSSGGSMGGVSYNDGGADFGGQDVSGWTGGGNGGGGGFNISGVGSLSFNTKTNETSLSPMGVGGGSVSLGAQQPSVDGGINALPSFAAFDPMSGAPIGGASNLSGLGQLAATPSFTAAPAIGAGQIDLGNIRPELSDINFSGIDAGMYPGATMPGGISNFAASPEDPGYTDVGVTAMRMAAGLNGQPGTIDPKTGIGYGTEFYLNSLNSLDPVSQTSAATILNRLMDKGLRPAFDIYGTGRTSEMQTALRKMAEAEAAKTGVWHQTARPGFSPHEFGIGMDVENLPNNSALKQIAQEEGWYTGPNSDPFHVQYGGKWGTSAPQVAQQVGASPVTSTAQDQMQAAKSSSDPLKSALNTVSNIAGELFGVKSASAEGYNISPAETAQIWNQFYPNLSVEVPRDPLAEMMNNPNLENGAEPFSPFYGINLANYSLPPRSQQQMLDVLGIKGSPPSAEDLTQAAQIAGSGVYPSYEQLGTLPPGQKYQDRAPGAAPNFPTAVQPAVTVTPPALPTDRFGAPELMATYGEEPLYAEALPRMGVDVFGLAGPLGLSELTVPSADLENPMDERGTPYPQTELDPNSYQNYTLNPEFAYQKMLSSLGWKSMFAPSQEEAISKMTSALERAGSQYDPTTGTLYAQDPATMQKALGVVPIELKDSEGNVVGTINAADFLTPVATAARTVPLPPTRLAEAMAAPVATPQTGLTGFEAALGSTPVSAPLTRGITAPTTGLPRQEPADPTQSTSPMTADQLKAMGIYRDTLQPGETIRQDFNAAYADATKRGIDIFEWTNPKTGATNFYKSGADEADLPAKTATPAKGQQAPQTEYEKTVATLEDAGQIANGMSKEEYAEAMGVPVEEVKTRITTQFGPPMAEYYTKTVLESLAGMTGGKTNMEGAINFMSMFSPLGILGLGGKAIYNQYKSGNTEENKAEGGYISPLASMGKR